MALHHFHLKANWPGLRNDVGEISTGNLQAKVSIPPEMNGPGIGTNPDEMLLGAAAACYIITLAAMMERSKLNKKNFALESEGIVEFSDGIITYRKIIHRPKIILLDDALDRDLRLAHRLAEKAEESCMISRALKGNVIIEVEPDIAKGM
ncbi:hypothetical protein CVD28_14080 [Bacillus sp. M6-12]|uniref:SACOL1771 family peroxiredoxin n=1 Tax=Bacillus sp. M6-12 TaxID=2054166 RepID=UPI000C756415|nr:SACOL1771 family peroxiredoxin [Bacillus sp. M6-12]PLS17176.1 hypothetical protein CVD28_14080 [Bacillus sp. M6-12]